MEQVENVKIQEGSINCENGKNRKVAVFTYTGEDDPVAALDLAVSKYDKNAEYNQFVDYNMDNPWIRVLINGKF
jgi:hypothetical protein